MHACEIMCILLPTATPVQKEVKKNAMKMEVITFLDTKWTLDKNVK
jgi:hypothetical protein